MANIYGRYPSGFSETIMGTSDDDTIYPLGGWDNVNGGLGTDTVMVAADSTAFKISTDNGTTYLDAISGASSYDYVSLQNVEYVKFNDQTVSLIVNDRIINQPGSENLDGGPGIDTLVYAGSRNNYTITMGVSYRATVQNKLGIEGADNLLSIERLEFSDVSVSINVQAMAASAPAADVQSLVELYVAFFNRVPDADGMSYWIDQMSAGQSITQIAEQFYAAGVQYSNLTGFSSEMSNEDFINVIYRNVLGRSDGADAGGLAYWTSQLGDGADTRGSLVKNILFSAHSYKTNQEWHWVADLLDNKIEVGKTFAITWGLNYNTPEDSISQGMAIAAAVTSTDTATAIALIGVPADLYFG